MRTSDPRDLRVRSDATRSCRSPARRWPRLPSGRRAPLVRTFELPLLGLSKDRPSAVRPHRSPLPGGAETEASSPPFGARLPRRTRVPPSCFRSTSTVFSFGAARACCSAQPTMGFTAFRRTMTSLSTRRRAHPRDACLPFEAILRTATADRHRAAAAARHRDARSPGGAYTVLLASASFRAGPALDCSSAARGAIPLSDVATGNPGKSPSTVLLVRP